MDQLITDALALGATLTVDVVTGEARLSWQRHDYSDEEWRALLEGLLGPDVDGCLPDGETLEAVRGQVD